MWISYYLLGDRHSEKMVGLYGKTEKNLVAIVTGYILVGTAQGKPEVFRFSREYA